MEMKISKEKNRNKECQNSTSMALTKYSDRTDIPAVTIASQMVASHLEISATSSSAEALSSF